MSVGKVHLDISERESCRWSIVLEMTLSPRTVVVTSLCHLLSVLLQPTPGGYFYPNPTCHKHVSGSSTPTSGLPVAVFINFVKLLLSCEAPEGGRIPIAPDQPACSSHSMTTDFLTLPVATWSLKSSKFGLGAGSLVVEWPSHSAQDGAVAPLSLQTHLPQEIRPQSLTKCISNHSTWP